MRGAKGAGRDQGSATSARRGGSTTTYVLGSFAPGRHKGMGRTSGGMIDTTKAAEEKKGFEALLATAHRPKSAGTTTKFDSADWGTAGAHGTGLVRKTTPRRSEIPDFVAEMPRATDGSPLRIKVGVSARENGDSQAGAVAAGRELLLPSADGRPETPGSAWGGSTTTGSRPLSRASSRRGLGPGTLTRQGKLSAKARPEFVPRLREKGESPYAGREISTKEVIEWNDRFAEALFLEQKRLRERVPAKPGAGGGSARLHRTISRSGLQWPNQTAQDEALEMDDLMTPPEESTAWADAQEELAKDMARLDMAATARPSSAQWGRASEETVVDREEIAATVRMHTARPPNGDVDLLTGMANALMPTHMGPASEIAPGGEFGCAGRPGDGGGGLYASDASSMHPQHMATRVGGGHTMHPQYGDGAERMRPPEALSPTVLRDFNLPAKNAHPSRQGEIDEFSSKAEYLRWLEQWLSSEDLSMDKAAFGQIAVYCESKLRGARAAELASRSQSTNGRFNRRSAKEKAYLSPNAFRLAVCCHLLDRLPVAPPGHELHALWSIIRGEVRNALYTNFEDPAPERRIMAGLAGAKEPTNRYLTLEPWFDRYSALLKDYSKLYENANKLAELGVRDAIDVKRLQERINGLEFHLQGQREKAAVELKTRISRRMMNKGLSAMWNTLKAHAAHARWERANKAILDGKRAVKNQQKRAHRIIDEMMRRHQMSVMHRVFWAWIVLVKEEKEVEAVLARDRVEQAMNSSSQNLSATLDVFQNVTMVLFHAFKAWVSFLTKEKHGRVQKQLEEIAKAQKVAETMMKKNDGYFVVMDRMSEQIKLTIGYAAFFAWRTHCLHSKEVLELRQRLAKYENVFSGGDSMTLFGT